MVILTMIARVADGLPLATSIEGDEQQDHNMVKYTNQAKMLFRKLKGQPPGRCSLESGPYLFHYLIGDGICYLCLCNNNFPKKLAFNFLDDISNEFNTHYGSRVPSVSRPYHFIEFDQYIQQAKRKYASSQAMYGLATVGNELQDVQKIMVQNINEVLNRGESLNMLDTKSAGLAAMSDKYKKDATYLNRRSTYTKIAAVLIIVVLILLYVRFRWYY